MEIREYKDIKNDFDLNVKRVRNLCLIYEVIKNEQLTSKEILNTDILRSAVVMLHSSFEEYYRSILFNLLTSDYDVETIEKIQNLNGKRQQKIELSDLIKYQQKTIDEYICSIISEQIDKASFSNYSKICNWAKIANIDLKNFKKVEQINNMAERRHKIVHFADMSSNDKTNRTKQIKLEVIEKWIDTVCELIEMIDDEIRKRN